MAEAKKKTEKKDAIVPVPEHGLPASLINTMEDLHMFSQAVFKSQLIPGIKNPETAMVRILFGRELGLKEGMSLRKIHVTPKNDIIIETVALATIAMNQGVRWQILQKDTKGCKLRIYKIDGSIPEHIESFTMEDAKRARLAGKDNYVMYPEEMCYNRCLSKGLKVFDPRIGSGLYTKEEMEDVEPFGSKTQQQDEQSYIPEEVDEEIHDAEIIEEEDYEKAVDSAMEKTTDEKAQEQIVKKDPDDPDLAKKKELISQIKEHLKVLELEGKDFKLYLSEKQDKRTYVRKDIYGNLSMTCAPLEHIQFLRENLQKISRRYVEDRMKNMKPGERIGCFVVPEKIDA